MFKFIPIRKPLFSFAISSSNYEDTSRFMYNYSIRVVADGGSISGSLATSARVLRSQEDTTIVFP